MKRSVVLVIVAACRLKVQPTPPQSVPGEEPSEELEALRAVPAALEERVVETEKSVQDGQAVAAEAEKLPARLRLKKADVTAAVQQQMTTGAFDPATVKVSGDARQQLQAFLLRMRDAAGTLRGVPEDVRGLNATLDRALPDAQARHAAIVRAARGRLKDVFASPEARRAARAELAAADEALGSVNTAVDLLRPRVDELSARSGEALAKLEAAVGYRFGAQE